VAAGLTLDAGALRAIDRGDRATTLLVARALDRQEVVNVPATALAQVLHNPSRQALLMRFLRRPLTPTVALDRAGASAVGQFLARTGTADVADAHVVACAQQAGQPIVTSDPDDLHRLDPTITLIPC